MPMSMSYNESIMDSWFYRFRGVNGFIVVTARLRMKFSLAAFYGGLKHMTNFSLFPNLGVVLKNSFPGNFTFQESAN